MTNQQPDPQNRQPSLEELRFPIGPFQWEGAWDETVRKTWTEAIQRFPQELRQAVEGLSDEELDTVYRPDGWTVRQVVHHLADSHMNSFIRFKLALTEDTPAIKPYREELWAELADTRSLPLEPSLRILEGVHARWSRLLESLDEEQLQRAFYHPESQAVVSLRQALGTYVWHGQHHLAHVRQALD